MKKFFKVLLMITMIVVLFTLPTIALADSGGATLMGFLDPAKVAETVLSILASAAITAIGVGGTWLTVQIGKNKKFERIGQEIWQVTQLAQQTVAELKQTVVDGLKAADEDGKLDATEIARLRSLLLSKTKEKMASASYDLLLAASVDIEALILGAGEEAIERMKKA